MSQVPLAESLRPKTFSEFVGQEHLVGKNGIITKLLTSSMQTNFFPSLIFWGPPGSGKTTLARIISSTLKRPFYEFSAVNASIKEIKDLLEKSSGNMFLSPILFVDEIHRFNKAQQDALLPHVEKGSCILIGATTENPSFEVISPLLSRCRVLILNQLDEAELSQIISRASKVLGLKLAKDSVEFLIISSNGDARVVINVLEIVSNISKNKTVTKEDIKEALQRPQLSFDLKGEEFYNTISALHKCIRASDPDAAVYYLARMLEAGQDPLYIARRLIRAASEDIGMADPFALVLATSAFEACNKIGIPECNVILAEVVVYLSKAKKSNAIYIAYGEAKDDVMNFGNLPVPLEIRNPVTKLMKEAGYGKDYNYYHSPTGEKLPDENKLPEKLKNRRYITKRLKQ